MLQDLVLIRCRRRDLRLGLLDAWVETDISVACEAEMPLFTVFAMRGHATGCFATAATRRQENLKAISRLHQKNNSGSYWYCLNMRRSHPSATATVKRSASAPQVMLILEGNAESNFGMFSRVPDAQETHHHV